MLSNTKQQLLHSRHKSSTSRATWSVKQNKARFKFATETNSTTNRSERLEVLSQTKQAVLGHSRRKAEASHERAERPYDNYRYYTLSVVAERVSYSVTIGRKSNVRAVWARSILLDWYNCDGSPKYINKNKNLWDWLTSKGYSLPKYKLCPCCAFLSVLDKIVEV